MPSNRTSRSTEPAGDRHRFGTFGGVFTPSILTILGVILFMRANFVVGQAGIAGAVLILLLAEGIALCTALSLSAIGTNMSVQGGGAYYLISRVLGAEFGGAIGIALFLAQSLSVPFYVLGFAEALVRTFPGLEPRFLEICLSTALLLFGLAYVGANHVVRVQYLILTILALSVAVLLGGALERFSVGGFVENRGAAYTLLEAGRPGAGTHSFWTVFAIYFPAVTGIMAGVSMSGDLADPRRSIPSGTLLAVGVGFVVYLLQILLCGGAFPREDLVRRPFETLHANALLGLGFLVTAGVFAATLSSALASLLGAPRVLQSLGRDRILAVLEPFARGTPDKGEPRRALLLTFALTIGTLLWIGGDPGGRGLNAVAAVITMFFLYTYGTTNLAAFIESIGDNPSFRPRFRFYHKSVALLGAVGCAAAAFLIQPWAALVAAVLVSGLLWYLRRQELRVAFGDARRGLVYAALRKNLIRLADLADDLRNWRPTILVFSGNPATRETLVRFADWLESGRGIVYLANILVGTVAEHGARRETALRQLEQFCREREIRAFPVAVVAPSLEQGVSMLLQAASVGPVHPNLAMFGWSSDPGRRADFLRQLRTASEIGMSLVLLRADGPVPPLRAGRIDIWWRGRKNGSLMVMLAHLLVRNREWDGASLRILRVIEDEAGSRPAREALEALMEAARVPAAAATVVSSRPFPEVLHATSADASCVFLGFELPPAGGAAEEAWHRTYETMLDGMPPTLIVSSAGDEDMLA